jgi:hypothetical protein
LFFSSASSSPIYLETLRVPGALVPDDGNLLCWQQVKQGVLRSWQMLSLGWAVASAQHRGWKVVVLTLSETILGILTSSRMATLQPCNPPEAFNLRLRHNAQGRLKQFCQAAESGGALTYQATKRATKLLIVSAIEWLTLPSRPVVR